MNLSGFSMISLVSANTFWAVATCLNSRNNQIFWECQTSRPLRHPPRIASCSTWRVRWGCGVSEGYSKGMCFFWSGTCFAGVKASKATTKLLTTGHIPFLEILEPAKPLAKVWCSLWHKQMWQTSRPGTHSFWSFLMSHMYLADDSLVYASRLFFGIASLVSY